MENELYYHFVSANKHLQYDLEDTEVYPGLKLAMNGDVELCERGFHASKRALDALHYAPPGAEWLCGVRLSGTVKHDSDKSVASEREVVWMLNVRKLLVEFAVWNAEQAFEAIRAIGLEPDERSIEAVRVVRLWLVDQASQEEVKSAADAAAKAAAKAADAAYAAYAANAAAYAAGAAADAAYAAYAAGAAAYAAAYAAGAAYAAYAAGAAADAADAAAKAAAKAAQNDRLEAMIAAALALVSER